MLNFFGLRFQHRTKPTSSIQAACSSALAIARESMRAVAVTARRAIFFKAPALAAAVGAASQQNAEGGARRINRMWEWEAAAVHTCSIRGAEPGRQSKTVLCVGASHSAWDFLQGRRRGDLYGDERRRYMSGSGKDEKVRPIDAKSEKAEAQAKERSQLKSEDDGIELYCSGLPESWNRDELRQLFEPLGTLISVKVPQSTFKQPDGLASIHMRA